MSRKRYNNPNFIRYEKNIMSWEDKIGLPYKKNKNGLAELTPASTTKGQERIKWATAKAKELGIDVTKSGRWEKLMFKILPHKHSVCRICGHTMSIKYIYPGRNLKKAMVNKLNIHLSRHEKRYSSILDIFKKLDSHKQYLLKKMLINKAHLKCPLTKDINSIVNKVEILCRTKGKHILSPGAMANFPDRLDGFHSYDICCRKCKDKGRHDSNMDTYNKDRRAYELLSDGNIVAANNLMTNDKLFGQDSADHIGPISLGFKHDPYNLRRLSNSANNAKRDKLSLDVINLIIKREQRYHINLMSYYGQIIWKHIKRHCLNGHKDMKDMNIYRKILKMNVNNFMYCLWYITSYNKNGKKFVEHYYLLPKKNLFKYKYVFKDLNNLNNVLKQKKNITKNVKKEYPYLKYKTFSSIKKYHNKSNRELKPSLNFNSRLKLKSFKSMLKSNNFEYKTLIPIWNKLLKYNQKELLNKFKF